MTPSDVNCDNDTQHVVGWFVASFAGYSATTWIVMMITHCYLLFLHITQVILYLYQCIVIQYIFNALTLLVWHHEGIFCFFLVYIYSLFHTKCSQDRNSKQNTENRHTDKRKNLWKHENI